MKILNLVTTPRPFFNDQVQILQSKGLEITTLQVPGKDSTEDNRSIADYLRFYPIVARQSLAEYDLIHANFGLTGPFALAQSRLPVVLSLWGSDLAGRYGFVSRICSQFSNEVIVMSEEMQDELSSECHLIPHGIDLKKFKPISTLEAKSKIGWEQSKKHVLFPYSPSRSVKNYPLAKKVVETVQTEIPVKVELQVVNNVRHDRVPLYMNAADALLLTSHREGFPNSVKEAMACNLPIVSTDVGGVRGRLKGVSQSRVGTNASELVNHLSKIIKDGKRSDGREHIDDLSLDQMADDMITIYKKAIS